MRDYSQFRSSFWTGETGVALRDDPDGQRLAAYLITSPHANVIGLYWLPVNYAAREIGLSDKQVSEALGRLSEMGFAHYDHTREFVWVVNMAREQLGLAEGEVLSAKDNRGKGARRAADQAKRSSLYARFVSMYGDALDIVVRPTPFEAPPRPPSKPLSTASEEQKGEGEGKGTREGTEYTSPSAPAPRAPKPGLVKSDSTDRVFAHWVATMGKDPARSRLNAARKAKLKARRSEGYTDEQLCQAVDGCRLSPFHMGQNDRGEVYTDLATILRDGTTVEKHIERVTNAPRRDVRRGFVDPAPASAFTNPTDLDRIFGPETPAAGSDA